MNKIRFYIALWGAKATKVVMKMTKHKGTNFPGVLALKICPNFLRYIDKPKKNIGVTGTNGKTTVTNLIVDMFKNENIATVNNNYGSNIETGIIATLIDYSTFFGKCKLELGVFEIDEKSTKNILDYLKLDYLIMTSLTRDSIMRNGHPEYIGSILSKYINTSTKLILNGDDLISANVAPDAPREYYAIGKMEGDTDHCINLLSDMQVCPVCNGKFTYEYLKYHHIGRVYCENCGFKSPDAKYFCDDINYDNATIRVVENGCDEYAYPMIHKSVFNIYNMVGIIALFREMGYEKAKIKKMIQGIEITSSRYENKSIGSRNVIMQMTKDKNAFACSRVFDDIAKTGGDKELILMNCCLSDSKVWSENTCWLYDCDFEFLNNDTLKKLVITGPRTKDYYLRALMAGIDKEKIVCIPEELEAPKYLDLFENDNIYLMYGADSIVLAYDVREKVIQLIEEKVKEGK